MKKRSLFAAVAMLVVSAMVLTSATYAWFNVGGNAAIAKTRGSVMQAGTGIRLKTDSGMDWNSTLLPQNFWSYPSGTTNKNHLVQHWTAEWDTTTSQYTYTQEAAQLGANSEAFYAPMSAEPEANFTDLTFYSYSIQGDNHFAPTAFTSGKTVADFHDEYEFHVGTLLESDYGSDVTATFKLGGNWDNAAASAAAAARAMVFISYDNGTTYIAYNGTNKYDATGTGKQYYDTSVDPFVYTGDTEVQYDAINQPISTTAASYIYDNGGNTTTPVRNYVMNSADDGYTANSGCFTAVTTTQMKNAGGNAGVTLNLKNVNDINNSKLNSSKFMIKVVVWIEGQDLNCAPALGGSQLTTEWTFEHAGDSADPNPAAPDPNP